MGQVDRGRERERLHERAVHARMPDVRVMRAVADAPHVRMHPRLRVVPPGRRAGHLPGLVGVAGMMAHMPAHKDLPSLRRRDVHRHGVGARHGGVAQVVARAHLHGVGETLLQAQAFQNRVLRAGRHRARRLQPLKRQHVGVVRKATAHRHLIPGQAAPVRGPRHGRQIHKARPLQPQAAGAGAVPVAFPPQRSGHHLAGQGRAPVHRHAVGAGRVALLQLDAEVVGLPLRQAEAASHRGAGQRALAAAGQAAHTASEDGLPLHAPMHAQGHLRQVRVLPPDHVQRPCRGKRARGRRVVHVAARGRVSLGLDGVSLPDVTHQEVDRRRGGHRAGRDLQLPPGREPLHHQVDAVVRMPRHIEEPGEGPVCCGRAGLLVVPGADGAVGIPYCR